MQKIVIKNFGAVRSAEIEVKKVLVLIGEQASGKSTIAKLIYFFKSLRDDLFNQIYKDDQKDYFDIANDLIYPIRNKFYDFFGSTMHLPDFTIRFYYSIDQDKYLDLKLDASKKLHPQFSQNFLNNKFKTSASQIKKLLQQGSGNKNIHEQLAHEQNKIKFAQRLSVLVNELFESNQTDSLFMIAGRNATVGYSDFFEKYLFASVQNFLEENIKVDDVNKNMPKRNKQTIDETLMLRFMEKVMKIKEIFKKFGNFGGLIENYSENAQAKDKLLAVKDKIDSILKGKYLIDTWEEKIVLNEELSDYVYLSNASSGQQESIRILQDIFMCILDNLKVLRILEEPEAHLFPVAQKQMIELLALMINQNVDSQLIITTHSPYVLTVFNNLLFAKRVVEKNPSSESGVSEVIAKDYWLEHNDFAAYSLGNESKGVSENYCISIVNPKTNLIEQNYLDEVSEMLGGDFDSLYSIHTKTFERK